MDDLRQRVIRKILQISGNGLLPIRYCPSTALPCGIGFDDLEDAGADGR
jgi:hypothetical protein